MRFQFALLMTIAAVSVTAGAQTVAAHPEGLGPELALQYSYLRTNAPVDQCTCFSLNGGSATVALPVAIPAPGGRFLLAGGVTVGHANNISGGGYDLTLSAFTVGIRYRPNGGLGPVKPFAQVLAGGAHASGNLVSGNTPAASDSGLVFASQAGGGLDISPHRSSHFAYRLVEANYLVTLFHNRANEHQNILQLSTGIVFQFGHRH